MGMLGIYLGDVDTGPGLTKQSHADEVDINKIVASFEKTGMVTHLNEREPFYGDVSEIGTYQESLEVVKAAEALFMGMDARIRERFDNDPAKMIAFLQKEENKDEAIKLGMVRPKPVQEPIGQVPELLVGEAAEPEEDFGSAADFQGRAAPNVTPKAVKKK